MNRIRLLDRGVYELIAAGEVVERPASAVKELVENSVDAGASAVSVSITGNGLKSMTVQDNGSGIDADDIDLAFTRHATSKISKASDLDAIGTLGFRGEALASISAVSRISLVTRTRGSELGTHYLAEGGTKISQDEIGCDYGTIITVSDIFFNVPARMKFLKKDVTEGNAIQDVVEREALACPDTSFRLMRDGKQVLSTPGDGDYYSAVYAVLPHEIADFMIRVHGASDGIAAEGFVSTPETSRKSRTWQYLSINGRPVRSKTVTAAVEEAFRNVMMTQRFPAYVISISMPLETIDVNVHPSKTEVKFENDRRVFNAVYSAVREAVAMYSRDFSKVAVGRLAGAGTPAEGSRRTQDSRKAEPAQAHEAAEPKQEARKEQMPQKKLDSGAYKTGNPVPAPQAWTTGRTVKSPDMEKETSWADLRTGSRKYSRDDKEETGEPAEQTVMEGASPAGSKQLRIIGEAFRIYIIAEYGDSLLYIDKHAAHERVLFEKIDEMELTGSRQILLEPVVVQLPSDQADALLEASDSAAKAGYEIESLGGGAVSVREIPTFMPIEGVADAVSEMASQALTSRDSFHTRDEQWLMHSVSCRAAIKAGYKTSEADMLAIARKIVNGEIPEYCPHGRPVVYAVTRRDLEKGFGRVR
ncbi:MAG: DNA mismatch repair endonuclease MutL [Oscillospiraceae bacterium]|jgi:DNA mismatch repair protein MutL